MTFFETVKNAVTVKQAAEHYGCKVNRGDSPLERMVPCVLPPGITTRRESFWRKPGVRSLLWRENRCH